MKQLSNKVFLACSVLCLGVLIGSAVQAQSVNVGQVDGSSSGIPCITPGEGSFVEFPELTLSLETHGRPILSCLISKPMPQQTKPFSYAHPLMGSHRIPRIQHSLTGFSPDQVS